MTATTPATSNIYFYVSYSDKNYAKSLGCKWDIQKKLWYIDINHINKPMMYKMYRVA